MERFNLNTWLEDKSRKIVTRDGKPARIICYDVKQGKDDCYVPIIALVDKGEEIGEMSYYYSEDGSFLRNPNQTHSLDLFFADEEEELTEFEKAVEKTIPYKIPIYMLKSTSQQLLELARKEIEKENSGFKPKFTYNEKDYSELGNKLIEFRNNTPLFSVSYRDGEGRKVILHYEKEIFDLVRKEIEKENPYSGNQKQEWSEDDEKLYISALWHIKNSCGNGGHDSGEYEVYNWLKSLKDRVQPKQEWSEEDKSMYIRTLGILGKCYMGELPTKVEEELKWFKSITDKAQPQTNQYDKGYEDGYSAAKYNQWKPKKEELEALRKRTYFCEGIDANLDSLYTNLLKL